MAKLVKVYDTNKEKYILINIDNISLIIPDYNDIYLSNNSKSHFVINTNLESINKVYEACGYYKTPTGQIEGKWAPWEHLKDGRIWSSPRKYSLYEAIDSNLIIGHCKCCSEQPCGHVFKKADHPNGKVRYICVFCGLDTTLIFNPDSTESEEKND